MHMPSPIKFALLSFGMICIAGGFLLVGGCLSTPRDFSSPSTAIRIVDQSGSPVSGIEVIRDWNDSDCLTKGSDTNITDAAGTVRFPKISAQVGLFTGAYRKAHDNLAPRGSASGTTTTIGIRLVGIYDVKPKDGTLRKVEVAHDLYEDKDGVIFHTPDRQSNAMTYITFPDNSRLINYEVSAKARN
jgi:hypothetical protein